jgi:hypothetical protein
MSHRDHSSRRRALLLPLLLLAPLLLGFLCFPLIPPPASDVATPVPAALFQPTVSASIAKPTPGVTSNVQVQLAFGAGSTLAIGARFDVPAQWSVASDGAIANGAAVASIVGSMTAADPSVYGCSTGVDLNISLMDATTNTASKVSGADANGNGTPDVVDDVNPANGLPDGVDRYPAFLNNVLPLVLAQWGATVRARYFGHTEAAGISDLYVNILVLKLSAGPYRVVAIINDPTSPPDSATDQFCAPQSTTLTLFGTSGGTPVYTNPASSGQYTFSAELVSEFDADNDGVSNGLDNCPTTFTAGGIQSDTDQDYIGDACDPTLLTQGFDVDGDGLENGYDNCIFASNASQADGDFDDLGDTCDPNPSQPNGPNRYLSCTEPVGIGTGDPGGASCAQFMPTPKPVGGIAGAPDVPSSPAAAPEAGAPVPLALIATLAALALASGGAWYARRRR